MSFKEDLKSYIDEYVNFTITEPGPCGGYIVHEGLEVPYEFGSANGGKNTPEEIVSAIIGDRNNFDDSLGILKDNKHLQSFMNTNKLKCGVDCSGLAYYVLNKASNGAVRTYFEEKLEKKES